MNLGTASQLFRDNNTAGFLQESLTRLNILLEAIASLQNTNSFVTVSVNSGLTHHGIGYIQKNHRHT